MPASAALFLFDQAGSVQHWRAIDDRVMGGVSHSRLRFDSAGHAVFEGEVSLAQGGGFASVRSAAGAAAVDGGTGTSEAVMEVRGDGRHYKLSLFIDSAFDTLSYQAEFTPPPGRWETLRLPLAGFVARFRGRAVAGSPPLDPARIRQVGLMIAERQAGPFALEIRSIRLA